MAKYKEIKGVTVQTRDTDPTVNAGTWASISSLNAANREGGGSGGPTTAINVGGYPYPMTSEHWNGTTWATFANMGTPRGKNASAGSYTNAIVGNGSTPGTPGIGKLNLVESWNGSSWTEIAEINSIRDGNGMSANGTSTAVIYFGGADPSPGNSVLNESWNGSAWTEVGDLSTARSYLTGIGIQTAALCVGGSPDTAKNESWNGSTWTEVGAMNTAGDFMGGSSGSQTSALVFGGDPGNTTKTESWDGTSWTEVNNLGTGRDSLKGAGSGNTSALAYGGYTSTDVANAEEWSFPSGPHLNEGDIFLSGGTTLKGFGKAAGLPSAAWSSVTNINTARGLGAGCGTQDSALIYAGFTSPPSTAYAQTEEWNGSTWTEKGDLNVPFYYVDAGGLGTVTAALCHGGEGPSGGTGGETFNGSSWSEISNSNSNHIKAGGAGSSTAGLAIASYPPTSPNEQVEEWNGSAWTEIADVNEGRGDGAGSGTSISAWWCGGEAPGNSAKTEVWNGSSWTESGDLNTARYAHRGSGANQNDGLVYGGPVPVGSGVAARTELWNGSTWTEINDLGTGRQNIQSSGGSASGSVSALASGGYNAGTNAVEEFVVDNTLSTVTVS